MTKLFKNMGAQLFSYRRRKLLLSSFKRMFRWEFWPMGVFYIPIVAYILWLAIRYRGLSFTAVNPGLPGSGFIGENKSLALCQLQNKVADKVAATLLIPCTETIEAKLSACTDFMESHQLTYPVVLKPDFGQRGIDVSIIANDAELTQYLQTAVYDTLLQEYVEGVEFGVFYTREPQQKRGSIFSITHKCFPFITGDGISSLETLISEHPRLHYMAAFLFAKYKNRLHWVPEDKQQVDVISLGTHSRGSLFLDGNQYFSQKLLAAVDHLSQNLEGFYFGRYDIRAKDINAFRQGVFKVIEVNGVTSESTDIYDPKNSIFQAYKILFAQWQLAFRIGKQNILAGSQAMSISDLINKVKIMNKGA